MSYQPPPQIDPYAVLGVPNNVSLPEIKAAHRKLVLKFHPDKVKDESLRNIAQDEFQKVQQAYELLSDDAARSKYDNDARLADLRKDVRRERTAAASSWSSPRTTAREYRDGRIYEERVPAGAGAGAGFFFDDDDVEFTEEPLHTSRKYDDYFPKRQQQRPKAAAAAAAGGGGGGGGGGGMHDKRRSKNYASGTAAAAGGSTGYGPSSKDSARSSDDHAEASFNAEINNQRIRRFARELAKQREKELARERAKERAKERNRETLEKMRATFVEPDDPSSESDASSVYVKVKRPSESKRNRPESTRYHDPTTSRTASSSSSRKARAESSSRRPDLPDNVDEDEVVDVEYINGYDKHDRLHTTAYDYILRSKGGTTTTTSASTMSATAAATPEAGRRARARARASQSPPSPPPPLHHAGRGGVAPETHSHASSRRAGRAGRYARSRDRMHASYDHGEPQFEPGVPPLPREATAPGAVGGDHTSSPRPSLPRAATAPNSRSRRDRSGRPESVLHNMAYTEAGPLPRPSRTRVNLDRHDSGYSSPGSTPDMPAGFGGSPKTSSARYGFADPEPFLVDPDRPSPSMSSSSSPRHHWNYAPLRAERPRMSVRSESKPSRSSTFYAYPSGLSSRYESPRLKSKLFGEFEFTKSPKDRDIRYARDFEPDDDLGYSGPSYVDHHPPHSFARRTAAHA